MSEEGKIQVEDRFLYIAAERALAAARQENLLLSGLAHQQAEQIRQQQQMIEEMTAALAQAQETGENAKADDSEPQPPAKQKVRRHAPSTD